MFAEVGASHYLTEDNYSKWQDLLQMIREFMKNRESFRTKDIVQLLGGVANKTAIARLNDLIKKGEVIRISRGEYKRS